MQQLEDDDELAYSSADDSLVQVVKEADGRPSWMRTLHSSATTWLQLLPKSLPTLKRTVENIKDPLYRYLFYILDFKKSVELLYIGSCLELHVTLLFSKKKTFSHQ